MEWHAVALGTTGTAYKKQTIQMLKYTAVLRGKQNSIIYMVLQSRYQPPAPRPTLLSNDMFINGHTD